MQMETPSRIERRLAARQARDESSGALDFSDTSPGIGRRASFTSASASSLSLDDGAEEEARDDVSDYRHHTPDAATPVPSRMREQATKGPSLQAAVAASQAAGADVGPANDDSASASLTASQGSAREQARESAYDSPSTSRQVPRASVSISRSASDLNSLPRTPAREPQATQISSTPYAPSIAGRTVTSMAGSTRGNGLGLLPRSAAAASSAGASTAYGSARDISAALQPSEVPARSSARPMSSRSAQMERVTSASDLGDESGAEGALVNSEESGATGTMHTSDIAVTPFDPNTARMPGQEDEVNERRGSATPSQSFDEEDVATPLGSARSQSSQSGSASHHSKRPGSATPGTDSMNSARRGRIAEAVAAADPDLSVSVTRSITFGASQNGDTQDQQDVSAQVTRVKDRSEEPRAPFKPMTPIARFQARHRQEREQTVDSAEDVERALGNLDAEDSVSTSKGNQRSSQQQSEGETSRRSAENETRTSFSSPAAGKLDRQQQSARARTSAPPTQVDEADAVKTPRVAGSAADRKRMANYLLSTVARSARPQTLRKVTPRAPLGAQNGKNHAKASASTSFGERRRTAQSPLSTLASHLQANADEAESMVSEVSSTNDLTVPAHRAGPFRSNTSFPGVGVATGAISAGAGTVDSNRLNSYLNKINEQFEDENLGLRGEIGVLKEELNDALARIAEYERAETSPRHTQSDGEDANDHFQEVPRAAQEQIELLQQGQRELNEELDRLEEEKAQMEEQLAAYKAAAASAKDHEREELTPEQASALRAQLNLLEADLADRQQDINDLELEMDNIKRDSVERMKRAMNEADVLQQESEQRALQERREIEVREAEARQEAQELAEDNQELQAQLEQCQEERDALKRAAAKRARDLHDAAQNDDLAQELEQAYIDLDEARERIAATDQVEKDAEQLRDENRALRSQLEDAVAREEELEGHIGALEDQAMTQETALHDAHTEVQELQAELDAADDRVLEEADRVEQKMKSKISDLEIELEEERGEVNSLTTRLRRAQETPARPSTGTVMTPGKEVQLETKFNERLQIADQHYKAELALKDEEIAHVKEIQRVTEERVEMLKKQSAIIESLADQSRADFDPDKTPVPRQVQSLRTARTPASPFSFVGSSFGNSTLGNKVDRDEAQRLQLLIDEGNTSMDHKLAYMNEQGFSNIESRRQLNDARREIAELKAELRAVGVPEPTRTLRDPSISMASSDGTTRRPDFKALSEQIHELKVTLAQETQQVQKLRSERDGFEKDNRALRDIASALNAKKSQEEDELKRIAVHTYAQTQKRLDRAFQTVQQYDHDLREERQRLCGLEADSRASNMDSAHLEVQLRQAEAALLAQELKLREKQDAHERMHSDLLERSTMSASAPLQLQRFQADVQRTAEEVAHMKNQRAAMKEERHQLHMRYQEAAQRHENVYAELEEARAAVNTHEIQLSEQIRTIESLHAQLRATNWKLAVTEDANARLEQRRDAVFAQLRALEAELRRVKSKSDEYGADLERARRDQELDRARAVEIAQKSIFSNSKAHDRISELERDLAIASKRFSQNRAQT
ncbi:hypothetical protein CBOM_05125 [Ceraceosorus bombacis]|uniref:Uncharacterized protein n=1 Tax=Ceraceosorus bombacis TaxID=401625 RepID=A0A0P1BI86_9BASI|nr:hypothetical protein CBOM_05125 [Ceraceosorus bombacis]